MNENWHDKLLQVQKEANKHLAISRLVLLREEVKKDLDEKINKLVSESDFLKKVRVPKGYIKLWKGKKSVFKIKVNWRYILSAPFIYGMIFPALAWHICIEIYHQVCFRLYGIPRVNYKEYFIYDRQLLSWLTIWEKLNCIYCSYVNNLIRYSSEIGGRTERYWCPIKYYRRINNSHSQYPKFVEASNPKKMRQQWKELRDFSDIN